MINNLDDIISHSLSFIEDDYSELWVIANKVRNENPELDFVELTEATKEVIRNLVEKKKVKICNEDTLKPMNLDVWEILRLVEERFRKLGRTPDIGDGIWFTV